MAQDSNSLIEQIKQDPVWSPPLENAIADIRADRNHYQRYITEVLTGRRRHGIIVGAPGTGKSFGISKIAKSLGLRESPRGMSGRYDYTIIKGHAAPSSIYSELYHNRHPGKILILDDCANAENDVNAMGILNAAMDTTDAYVSWESNRLIKGTPSKFKFEGSVILVSNTFDLSVTNAKQGGIRYSRIESITNRVHPFVVGNRDRQTVMAHIVDLVANEGVFDGDPDLNEHALADIIIWMVENMEAFKQLSVRQLVQVVECYKNTQQGEDWRDYASRVFVTNQEF